MAAAGWAPLVHAPLVEPVVAGVIASASERRTALDALERGRSLSERMKRADLSRGGR